MVKAALLQSRTVIRIGGDDSRPFLEGLITQEPPPPGEAAFAALLTPQGKISYDFNIVEHRGAFLLDCHAATADGLVKRLSLYKLRAKVSIERLELSVGVFFEGRRSVVEDDLASFDDPRLIGLGQRVIGPAATIARIRNAISERRSEVDYNAHRLSLGVPEFGKDFASDEVFLLDVNYDALNGVSYSKGCFVGQEVTSRMKRKGEIRKRTLRLSYDGDPPAKGSPVNAGGSSLGEVMSGIEGAGLALIRIDRLAAARAANLPLEAAGKPLRIDVPAYLERG